MVETDAWVSGCCPASAEHPTRVVRQVPAAQGEARKSEAPVVVARPAGEHLVAWERREAQLFVKIDLPATQLGVERKTAGVSLLQLAGPGRPVEAVVEDRCDSARYLESE